MSIPRLLPQDNSEKTFDFELECIKSEMEAKIRVEMEAKIRMEMEAKIRMEMIETMRKLEEEKKIEEEKNALDIMKTTKFQDIIKENVSYLSTCQDQTNRKAYESYIEFIRKKRILFSSNGMGSNYVSVQTDVSGNAYSYVWMFATDSYLGIYRFTVTPSGNREDIIPLYIFHQCLTLKDFQIIDQLYISKPFRDTLHGQVSSPVANIINILMTEFKELFVLYSSSDSNKQLKINVPCSKKFESVVTLIPGSYQNGPWKQLDGLFGMYFNEETLELSVCPPPMA